MEAKGRIPIPELVSQIHGTANSELIDAKRGLIRELTESVVPEWLRKNNAASKG